MSSIEQTIKDVAILPRKTLTELINETDASIYYTLKNSVYPGAKDESIAMVIAACKARDYPILSKCYHIVPMSVKNAATGQNEWRDVIMPGITLYRIEADRSESYIGLSEPMFGPMIKETMNGKAVEYPEWCKIIASKILPNGKRADFPAIEYWKENYATKGKDSSEPNSMWAKRPRAQLAKCTEAQALRRAFPDILGSNVTFEEMEDKQLIKDVDGEQVENKPTVLTQENTTACINADQLEILKSKLAIAGSTVDYVCNTLKLPKIEAMTPDQFRRTVNGLDKKIKTKEQSDNLKSLAANKGTLEIEQDKGVSDFISELGAVDLETGEVIE